MISFADLFAGGGGTSTGAFMVPGIHVSWALNHDPVAIKTHEVNHPETKHFQADIRTQNVHELEPVDVLWASLECTNHSKAKGGKDKDEGSFTLGWELPRYLVHCNPDYLYIENVPEFIRWGELKDGKRVKDKEGLEYLRWIRVIKDLGYVNYERRFLNAADYGCPTRRIRYFGIFSKPGCPIIWPRPTHSDKENMFGLKKWVPCKDYIDLTSEGNSIFGREHNEDVYKGRRTPLSENTLRRIAGGIRKFAPDVYFVMQYYGNGLNCQSIDKPLNTVTTKDRHALIKVEKMQFIQDHCHTASYQTPEDPLRPQLTRQTKQLITVESQIVMDGNYNRDNVCNSIDRPLNTIIAQGTKRLITAKAQFISKYYSGDQVHAADIKQPLPTITTKDHNVLISAKAQFISHYFNGGGHPEAQNQSLHGPLNSITTKKKGALVTISQEDLIDFDIKMRFLTEDELAAIMGFPKGYFKRPGLKLSKKEIIKMIGNAVPVGMAKSLLEMVPLLLHNYTQERIAG